MKKISLVLALMFVGACGGDVCQKAVDAASSLKSKASACSTLASVIDAGATQASNAKSTCETNVKNCTSDDLSKINATIDCVNSVAACVSGQEKTFTDALSACAAKRAGVTCDSGTSSTGPTGATGP
jgi:hypothetical protein